MSQTPFYPPPCPRPVRPAVVPKPVMTVNGEKPDAHGNVNVPGGEGDVKHTDFADMEIGGKMNLDEVNSKVDQLITRLKGMPVVAFALLSLSSFAAALGPTTRFGAVHPDTTLREVVVAGGIPAKVSDLTNDLGFVDRTVTNGLASVDIVPAKVSDLTNDAAYVTASVTNGLVSTNALRLCDGAARPLPRYLHALDFDDSYPEAAEEYYRSRGDGKVDGGCSAVRSGNFLYRNFDFPFDDRAEFVVKMSAASGRFASVGVAQVGTNLTEAIVTSGRPSPCYKWLPGATVDGINENGVACEINVVDGDPQTSGWHTTGDLHPLGAIRWILDHATNAQHAATYIAANIRFPQGWSQNFHYMIADATSTYIVENGNCYQAGLYDLVKPVLTNFRVVGMKEGSGIERYDLLLGGANITNAWYTRAYRRSTNPPWVSDLAEVIAYTNEIFDAWSNHPKEYFRGKTSGGQPWWQTVHTSIYDITNRVLRVAVQEQDDWYMFQVPDAGVVKVETDPTVPAWAKQANPPEGMTDNALVLTNGAVKTKSGTAVTPANIGAASASDLDLKLDKVHPEFEDSYIGWDSGYLVFNCPVEIYGNFYLHSGYCFYLSGSGSSATFGDGSYADFGSGSYATFGRESSASFSSGAELSVTGGARHYVGFEGYSEYQDGSALRFDDEQGEYGDYETIDERIVRLAPSYVPSATDTTFSNAVLAVGLNIDTNSVAVLNEIAATFGGFPITGTATTVGGLLAALAAAVAWLRKNKIDKIKVTGMTAEATAENGVAKLDDFFKESNTLLMQTMAIPFASLPADNTTSSYKRFRVTVSDDMTIVLHTPTSGDAEIFECRFDGSGLAADKSIEFSTSGATATTMDTDCGTVKAGKIALMSAFWNGTTWDVNWKVEG